MDSGDVRIQNLEGPFNYHLYIGFAPADKKTVLKLRAELQKHGLICFLRFPSDSSKESIQEGVNTSQKCLLFLTSDYLKDDWCDFETLAVVEKSKCFFHDMVIILKSDDLEVVPERLRKFHPLEFQPEYLKDEKFMAQFVDMIVKEPNVNLAIAAKQIPGYESACNYFYGFLRYVLSDFTEQLVNRLKDDQDLLPNTIKKMLIIMPESCICPTELKVPEKIEFTGKFIVRVAHRAGNAKRDYKSSLYKLIDPVSCSAILGSQEQQKQQEYYFVGEFATPLVTMYDAYLHGLCGLTKDDLYAGRDGFYFTLKAILSHPDNAECNNQFKLLYWSDPATEKANQLYDFLLPILRKEISLERENEENRKKLSKIGTVHLSEPNQPSLNTFGTVSFDGLACIYEDVKEYPMGSSLRGLCLIINIVKFDNEVLETRTGAEKDEELLEKLFYDLHFNVQVHKDVDAQTLESLFLAMHNIDHTNYNAFVCCIMTHGKLGVIYTSDGREVEILKLVEYFTDKNCPSLKGKPKMFFIQACQTGGNRKVECVQEEVSNIKIGSNIAKEEVESEIMQDAKPAETFSHDAVLVPGSPDFLMSYSTLPGSVSYRHIQTGSFYIQALDQCLRRGMEMDRALKTVTSSVREKMREQDELDGVKERLQLPFHLTSAMDRLIHL